MSRIGLRVTVQRGGYCGFQFHERCERCVWARNHEQTHRSMLSERFVHYRRHPAAHLISDHGLSDRLAHRDADQRARVAGKRITAINDETLRCNTPPLPPQANKIRLTAQAGKAAHLDGKAMTPLLPAPRNNLTTMLASHPLKKTVHALTPAVVRLIRPLHNVPSEF